MMLRFFVAVCFALVFSQTKAEVVVDISMYVGEIKILPMAGVSRVAVGNGKLLSVTVLKEKSQLLFIAEDAGETKVHLWTKGGEERDYTVRIATADTARVLREVETMLRDVPAARVRSVGDRVLIEGGNLTSEQMAKVASVVKIFPQVTNLVEPEKVRLERMIYLDVQIMEFNKRALERLGIDWQKTIDGPGFATAGDFATNGLFRVPAQTASTFQAYPLGLERVAPMQTFFGIATEVTSRINLLVNNGEAYILASPKLSTKSGGEAKFLAGGEVPIPLVGALGQTSVTFKQYGIQLNIKPVADADGKIMAKLETEISSIDPSVQVLGVPGFLTRKTDADINVRDGETLVISGLVNAEAAQDINKLPGLGNIPVLGNLFKSTEFRNKRTDLVIFVTPRIHRPDAPLNQQEIQRAERLRGQFKGTLGKGIVD